MVDSSLGCIANAMPLTVSLKLSLSTKAAVKAAGVKTRLAAGEQEATGWGFHDLIHRGRIDVRAVLAHEAAYLIEDLVADRPKG